MAALLAEQKTAEPDDELFRSCEAGTHSSATFALATARMRERDAPVAPRKPRPLRQIGPAVAVIAGRPRG